MENIKRFDPHVHSHYSNLRLLDAINRPKDLFLTADKLGLAGFCVTEHEALCSHVEFLQLEKKLKKEEKISKDFKLGLGNEIYLIDSKETVGRYYHFILIAKNNDGHRALRELSSMAWYGSYFSKGMERVPTLKYDLEVILDRFPNTLIGTTACLGGEFASLVMKLIQAEKEKNQAEIIDFKTQIVAFLSFGKKVFGEDFYVEIAPAASRDQIIFNKKALEIAKALNLKTIIGTDAHYLTKKDRLVHKAYLNSNNKGEREVDEFYSYAYLMDNEEAYGFISNYTSEEDFTIMCNNSIELMNKIEGYNLERSSIIPIEPVKFYPKETDEYYFDKYPNIRRMLTSDNEQERYWMNTCLLALREKDKNLDLWNHTYWERIDTEADVVAFISERLGEPLTAYFNTLQYYINLFWESGSIVGPGRGSAVGFLTNYLLGITQLDPIKWDLPYWRFLNKERVEMPDIDIDLAPSKRPLIFKRIRKQKGELNLLQVCTFGTEGTRSAIQTACRGYSTEEYPTGIDVDIAQYMSGLIPQHRGFLWSLNDVVNGNEEEDRKPVKAFIEEVNKYPGLLEIMTSIEGIINKRSQHASGVILYNESPYETNAVMRSPGGELTTQFALHESEWLGDIKYDFLVTEVSDKIINCLNLLKKDNYFEEDSSLRVIYDTYLHPEVMDYSDKDIWKNLSDGSVIDVFQFNSEVGLTAAKTIKPNNPLEMTAANALMRLMGEKGNETPLNRYTRMKNNLTHWYQEMKIRGLTQTEVEILEPYYKHMYGTPCFQEDMMKIVMDKDISDFTLKESNATRKTVAKKKFEEIPKLQEDFFAKFTNKVFAQYVWDTAIAPQLGYSFSLLHSLAYSFVGIQTLELATKYPNIYWNCACLITNSGGNEDEEEEIEIKSIGDDDDEEDIEYEDEEEEVLKKKNKTTNYGKISTAIGVMQKAGILVSPPNINKSSFTFIPDTENNTILYGVKGINKIGSDLVNTIIANRPYSSVQDFLNKIKVNKPQMVNLIKSGAFDKFGSSRYDVMKKYIASISDQKQKLNLQNMQMLINFNLIPKEYELKVKIYNFNKYLKKVIKLDDEYGLDEIAYNFYADHFDVDELSYNGSNERVQMLIDKKVWDKIYKSEMDSIRDFIKANQVELLEELNDLLMQEMWDKYCLGSISKWEMDSISFYYHKHELADIRESAYNITNFFNLPSDPIIDRVINMKGRDVPLYKLYRIAGTVLDKNKNKSSISLLTKYGVVQVKVYQAQFSKYDKQLSQKMEDGKKKIIEKSWFSRGNKIVIVGIRRDDTWIPKLYKNSDYTEPFNLITKIEDDGFLELKRERVVVD